MPASKSFRSTPVLLLVVSGLLPGCSAAYKGVVKPMSELKSLSPELAELSDAMIEKYLAADVKPEFPTVAAVARLDEVRRVYNENGPSDQRPVSIIPGEEAGGWRQMTTIKTPDDRPAVEQVQVISPLLVGEKANLKSLRDAAAMLHASLLLVYTQATDSESGHNPAAMAYWTIVGLFFVPGNTVGCYSTCQGLLVDTRTGAILATFEGEGKREENVLAGAVDIAYDRVMDQAQHEAVHQAQHRACEAVAALAGSSYVPPQTAQAAPKK